VRPLAAEIQSPGALGLIPVGGQISGPFSSLPVFPGAVFAWADGGLIDRTAFSTFFGVAGHVYNGGVDPGSNKVRKPDKRGRVSVGADNFGQGEAGRIPNSNRALGQNGGEERHAQTSAELAVHAHVVSAYAMSVAHGQLAYGAGSDGFTGVGTMPMNNTGSGTAANVMQPYEVDVWVVRVA